MNVNYFHIPTRIIQGYESYTNVHEILELSKKRVIMVTDQYLMNHGATQNLRRYIDNIAYGLIFYEIDNNIGMGVQSDALSLVRDSRAQTIIGFGNTQVLSIARAMAQLGRTDYNINYIEIPSIPCVYTGLLETYYVASHFETIKKPYKDLHSRAEWMILDSSFTEFSRVDTILEFSAYSLAYALDALFSRNATMLAESYALKAIELIYMAGKRLAQEPTNIKLKNELMLGALLSSFAIQSSNLGVSAGLAMALESSLVCTESQGAGAVLLNALEYALVTNIDKFQKIARVLELPVERDPIENSIQVIEAMKDLLITMEIKPLSFYPVTQSGLDAIARQASRYPFMLDLSRPAGFYELSEIANKAYSNGIQVSSGLFDPTPKEEPVAFI